MSTMELVFLLLGIAFGTDLHEWDMVPPDETPTNSTNGNLGICFGSSTSWSAYPYVVALRRTTGSACCSGSIISMNPGIILTAAHCDGCTGTVRIGCNDPSNCDGDEYEWEQFIQHPSYRSPLSRSNDIAVMRLDGAINTLGASEISVPSVEPSIGDVRVVGYGITQTGSIPTTLQTMQSTLIEEAECNSIFLDALGEPQRIDNTMICIRGGKEGEEDVPTMCSGDSGGPISSGNYIYGVNSWVIQGSSDGCKSCDCCPGYPQVGSNVAHNAEWINGYLDAWKKGDFNYTFIPK